MCSYDKRLLLLLLHANAFCKCVVSMYTLHRKQWLVIAHVAQLHMLPCDKTIAILSCRINRYDCQVWKLVAHSELLFTLILAFYFDRLCDLNDPTNVIYLMNEMAHTHKSLTLFTYCSNPSTNYIAPFKMERNFYKSSKNTHTHKRYYKSLFHSIAVS